jgi:ectoine hydroxylase-related dioxygenase (phytanoyl-CoA dioxygenase family)
MLHQDWSYAHEDITSTATLWLPLQNTTKRNGALFFVPGSHLFFKNYRSGSLPSSRIPMDKELEKYTVTVEVNEGEAIIFHQALFHGSHPNTGKENRVVAASIIIPENEELLYFHQSQNTDLLQTHSLTEPEFFEHLQELSKGETFKNIKTLGTTSYHHKSLSGAQLCEEIEKHRHHVV